MRRSILAGIAVVVAVSSPSAKEAAASELELKPALSVSEEYNDNIFGTADGRRTDFVTRVQPGAMLHYRAAQLGLDGSYIFDYRNYAKGSHGDEEIHNADVKGNLQFLDDFLMVDFGDALHRTTVNAARDIATESLLVNQTSQNIAFVSPYLLWRLGGKYTLKTGYRYTDTRYFDGIGIDRREHSGFVDFQHQVSEELIVNCGYAYTHADVTGQSYDRNEVSAGFRYNLAKRSSIFGSVGNSWNDFKGKSSTSDFIWDAGMSHDFGRTVALLETKVENIDDPLTVSTRRISYSGRVDRAFDRGGLGVSAIYLEDYVTETGKLEHRRGTLSSTGRYEVLTKLTASGALYAERFSKDTADQYPYRLTANSALTYAFYNDKATVTLAYTFVVDRLHLDSSSGDKLTNRVLVEARTMF
jgi:hypothetical protein